MPPGAPPGEQASKLAKVVPLQLPLTTGGLRRGGLAGGTFTLMIGGLTVVGGGIGVICSNFLAGGKSA